jgi:hypothetical protein
MITRLALELANITKPPCKVGNIAWLVNMEEQPAWFEKENSCLFIFAP